MRVSKGSKLAALLILGMGVLIWEGELGGQGAFAQSSSQATPAAGGKDVGKEVPLDEYQRSGQVLYMQRMGKSGWQRGQEIYFTKCWICHNDYSVKADPKEAPTLQGLYQRPMLMSGQPVNDATVAAKIRDGGPRMPAYRHGLNDKDIADLVTYLREKCCWDADHPPANSRYRNP